MKKQILLVLLCAALALFITIYFEHNLAIKKNVNTNKIGIKVHENDLDSQLQQKIEIPALSETDIVINHFGFSLLYNEEHEQASWVAYELTSTEINKIFDRTNKFILDPQVKTTTASGKDYLKSGYDRGHLAPASDMGWSSITMAESFYYSNISPQIPEFNRGVWKRLEELVRSWAIKYETINIVTGPILTPGLPAIGPNQVTVPNLFYKVILDYNGKDVKGIGFILPNLGSKEILQSYAVSIDSVESLTGIDFFPMLNDDQEIYLESAICLECWSW